MTDSSILTQLPELLADWIPEAASIAIADQYRYVVYQPGAHDIKIKPGDAVRPGSVANSVFRQQGRVEKEVDASVFGVPYYGLGYPLYSDDGLESALTVILPPKRPEPLQELSFVMGHTENLWRPVPIEDIEYFESYEKKTWLRTDESGYTAEFTIQTLEKRLPSNLFVRIHRSYIINIAYIDYIERDERSGLVITMKNPNQTRLHVGPTYIRHVRDKLGF